MMTTVMLLFMGVVYSQNRTITGNVTDKEDGLPLIGVTVYVEGTNMATITDVDGNFRLQVAESSENITFSYIGMETVVLPVKTVMTVVLSSSTFDLTEVVVTGYQRIVRKMFTGSASVIKAEDAKIDGVADVSRMLQGKAAGIQLTNVSGTFGAAPKLRVRGATSIYGNSRPLWVVDGVILDEMINVSAAELSSGNAATLISSAVAGLNADDIETFQILKDASATALYGAKAMNGVIVITTKKGRKGTASINYTGEFIVRTKPYYGQYDILNSQDQMSVFMDLESNGRLESSDMFLAKDGGVFSKWYQMTDMRDENGNFLVENTTAAKLAYLRSAEMRNTNWFNELFRNTIQQQHAVSISSGTDKSSNYNSISYFNDPGWTTVDKVDRFTFNSNTTYNFSRKLTIGILGNASIRVQKAPGTLNRQINVVEGEYSRDFDINPFSYALNTTRTMDANEFYRRNYAPFNIKHEIANNYIDLNMMDTKLQFDLLYKPITGLEITALGAVRYGKTTREHRILNTSNMAEAYRAAPSASIQEKNNFLWQDPDDPDALPIVAMGKGGFFNTQDNSIYAYNGRLAANYIRSFDDEKHLINLFAGAEIRNTDRLSRFNNGYGYLWGSDMAVTDYRIIRKVVDAGDAYFGMGQTYERQVGFFGTGAYSLLDRYILNLTLRTEGTNQMGRSSTARWLPTWNISGSWNILNEKFMKGFDKISQLNLRGTYGLSASMIAMANAMAVINAQNTYRPFQEDREVMLFIESLENKELTWEKMYETNVGFDLGFFRNRFSVGFDAYWRDCFDLLGRIRTSGVGGEHIKLANIADMESNGIEFTVNTVNMRTSDFEWSTNLTFAYNRNKITNLKSESQVIDLVGLESDQNKKEGYAQSALFSIPFARLDEHGHPMFYDENGEEAYYIYFQNSTNTDFLKYEGQLDPKYTGGFENSFSYKNLKLSVFMTYQAGNVIRLYPSFRGNYSDIDAMSKDMNNRWVKPGDELYTNVPSILTAYYLAENSDLREAYNAYNFSTERVAKGDFVRLKDVTLSYDFSKKLVNSIGLSSLQIRGIASNLWLIYADKKLNGQDPEFSRSGGVAMPTPKQFTLSLRAGF